MGELVVHRTRVESLAAGSGIEGLAEAVQDLTRSSQALQALVMQVRMIAVDAVFMRFPRLVRDLSAKMDKQVDLVLTGRETELDRTVVDALGDPLVHLVRNSLDHALESPAEREAAGKPATGVLEISARHAGGNVVITVRDDGRGIDPARVAAKACERGLIAPDAVDSIDMARAIELLFTPGFSTADQTSDISGRGVGMDAVRTALRGLGGAVVMTSEKGVGTTVQVRLPLTLAIMPALLVESGAVPFAIPLERVERTLNLARPDGAVGDRQAHAGALRRRAAADRSLRSARPRGIARRLVRRHRAGRRAAPGAGGRAARRPARAGDATAARRGGIADLPVGRRGALGRDDQPDRGLRRAGRDRRRRPQAGTGFRTCKRGMRSVKWN